MNAPSRPTETDGSGRTQRAQQVAQVMGVFGSSPLLASSSWSGRGCWVSFPYCLPLSSPSGNLRLRRATDIRPFSRGRWFKRFPSTCFETIPIWDVRTTDILPARTLLDAICTYHEHLVRRATSRRNDDSRAWIQSFVRSTTRDAVMNLLDKKGFLAELRERLPSHELIGGDEPLDLDYWKLAAQNESHTNDQSDIDIDDAYSIAAFAEIMSESILASLRGG